MGKRATWSTARLFASLLFIFCLAFTVATKMILALSFLFGVLVLVDILLLFFNLILLQLLWEKGSLQSTQQIRQPSAPALDQVFPLTLHGLLSLTPTAFEHFVGVVIEAMGMGYTKIQHIGGSGDWGADLLARNYFDQRIIVQCKLYAPDNFVDSPDMQRFLGSIVHYRAIYGWFVTTSSFTKPALDFVAMNSERIRVLDGKQLLALIQQRQREMYLVWQQRKQYETLLMGNA